MWARDMGIPISAEAFRRIDTNPWQNEDNCLDISTVERGSSFWSTSFGLIDPNTPILGKIRLPKSLTDIKSKKGMGRL